MTAKEYVQAIASFINGLNLDDTQIDFILSEQGISSSMNVVSLEDKKNIQTSIFYQIPLLIAGMQNIQEGGYSISWNVEGLKLWYSVLAKKLGLEDELNKGATITDRSNYW